MVEFQGWLAHFINWKCQCMLLRITFPDIKDLFGAQKISDF